MGWMVGNFESAFRMTSGPIPWGSPVEKTTGNKLLGLDIAKDEPTATVIFEMVDGGILGGTVDAITSDSDA